LPVRERCPDLPKGGLNSNFEQGRTVLSRGAPPTTNLKEKYTAMRAMLAAAIIFGFASVSDAKEFDLSKMTCQQFLQSSKDEVGMIMTWLDGYYHEEGGAPIFSTEELADDAKSLNKFCTANPTVSTAEAAEKVFNSSSPTAPAAPRGPSLPSAPSPRR
jgi:acid stress chaperone HdeB